MLVINVINMDTVVVFEAIKIVKTSSTTGNI